ncbi:MAG: 3'-5' exonuclease [Candidatus Competibacteraceae bacterium]|nr:3'-5' exonuclease [Candidatus Competibacteraceae bacterium]
MSETTKPSSSALPGTVFVFDIETVPDITGGRHLLGLENLADTEVAEALFFKRRQEIGGELLRAHLQRIVAISVVMRTVDRLKVWSLGGPEAPEEELIRRFFAGIEEYRPTLVSWNGGGFDLPVLHYRALLHGVSAPRYWDTGDQDQSSRWNNYLSRFHWRHLDLMDVLSAWQPRMVAPLAEIAVLLGFPGKLGMDGSKVWAAFQAGDIAGIRHYCETDVLNTYLIYLRFELIRGRLSADGYQREGQRLRELLTTDSATKPHFGEFLAAWRPTTGEDN